MAGNTPKATRRMNFQEVEALRHVGDPIHRDLSCIAGNGESIFVACDETAGFDRLDWDGKEYGGHHHFGLGDIFELPGGPAGEMDIEGLDISDGWLWVCGSNSLKRGKPAGDDRLKEQFADLAEVAWDVNRQFLGRLPLVEGEEGIRPVAQSGERRAAHLRFGKRGRLRRWLAQDEHLSPFLNLPSKENGLDIEGIATAGNRIFLGLRGPVLRNFAVVLELRMKEVKSGHLKAEKIDGKRRYRKHFVDTNGQGIRDLKLHGDALMVMTGTVMAGDGPSEVLRLPEFTNRTKGSVWYRSDVEQAIELPYRGEFDHPEGLLHLEKDDWLVVYDSPRPSRVSDDPPWVKGDVWAFG